MEDPIPLLRTALEGRYRIERELGVGGMSTVYLARDLRNDREVALKILLPDLAAVVAGRRFLGEIHTTARLQHPHILPLFDSGEAGGFLYYVMPYVKGESLRARLDREGELPVDEALRIATDLAHALDYAHREGVVHRDIKPANVLLHEGKALISDFGIALAVDAAAGTRITGTGQSVGTPHYMSPEQSDPSGQIDRRSDIYALGCLLHEMLAGEPVFEGRTPRKVLAKHLTATPTGVRALRTTVPKGVEAAILCALKKSPADRFSTMADFATAIEAGAAPSPAERVRRAGTAWVRHHPFSLTAASLALVGTVVVAAPFFSGPAWSGRPSSVAVLPFRTASSSEAEVALAIELADEISREIQRWQGITVASDIDLAGPRRELGLDEPTLEEIGDGAALADLADSEAMLALTVRQVGEELSLQASLFDTRSRRRVGEPVSPTGLASRGARDRLIAPVVAEVLGFGDAPEPARALGAGTSHPDAAVAYLKGRQALERNDLDVAEELFSGAIALDSTFASALSFLGQTHFWRGAESDYFVSRGSDISRWSTAATRYVAGLSPSSEGHVRAFYALQLGDFDSARARYRDVLSADPSDGYALLMLGELDLLDRWSVRDERGSLVPRSNMNRARNAFASVVRAQPTFELAYGRIFAIQDVLENSLRRPRACAGFEEVREDFRPIWEPVVPGPGMYPACLIARDSMEWAPLEALASLESSQLRAGAGRYFDRALAELSRWATFAPDQPRPLELLSEAYMLRRSLSVTGSPERVQALASQALDYRNRALELDADTTASELVELANVQLAAGQTESAIGTARRALERYQSEPGTPPPPLLNVLVAAGQISEALDLVDRLPPDGISGRYHRHPETGEVIPLASGGRVIQRLRVLAAAGTSGPILQKEVESLGEAWAAEGYPGDWQAFLRAANTVMVAPSFAFDEVALSAWAGSVDLDDPIWLALSLTDSDPERARRALRQAPRGSDAGPVESFVLAVAAGRLGLDADAISYYSRLDSVTHRVQSFDQAWGLQVLSHYLRASHYEAAGDFVAAADHLRSFIRARSWPDSVSMPLVIEARARLARIDEEG